MPDGDGYLAAAYLVFLALVLIYVAIMAVRLGRLERETRRAGRAAPAERRRHERADPPRRLAQDRAGRAAREARADRARRGRRSCRTSSPSPAIHEAVAISTCNRTEVYLVASDGVEGESAALGALAGRARHPADRARRGHLLAAQLRRRAPALPRHGRARVDDRRRVRGPGPGQARLRGRARARGRPAADRTACSAPRWPPASACAPRPGSGSAPRRCRRWPSTSRPRCSATSPAGPS